MSGAAPLQTSWHGRALDEIEDECDSILRALRELWPAAKRGGPAGVLAAAGLRELADLHTRRSAIEGEAGL